LIEQKAYIIAKLKEELSLQFGLLQGLNMPFKA